MNICENLCVTAMEECAEIQQALSKCLRFGIDNFHPNDLEKELNGYCVIKELVHLNAVISSLQDSGYVPRLTSSETLSVIQSKNEAVKKYQEVSARCGTIT